MFIMIIVLEDKGITSLIASFIGTDFIVFKYGVLSFLSANVINNIPMSALFSSIASTVSIEYVNGAVFASIIGSNLGAFLTPIGALAGIMWNNILKNHGVKYGYLDFIKTGAIVALPTLIVALITLSIVI
jgi:arsenical pump membrane protein